MFINVLYVKIIRYNKLICECGSKVNTLHSDDFFFCIFFRCYLKHDKA